MMSSPIRRSSNAGRTASVADEVLRISDVISVHVPLVKETGA